jgi:peptidoglycan/LPS O-acetylase OafA/YrhL
LPAVDRCPSGGQAALADITHAHYVQLDGLRGLAILLVMLYHFCLPHVAFHDKNAPWLLQLAQGGWMGVDLFFVLSGFLITGILLQTRSRPHYFRNFLGRRFLRIWPLYYLSLVVLLVLPALLTTSPPGVQSMQDKQAWFWLYMSNWLFAKEGGFSQTSGGYFWSLAVEEQFYLLWPLVVYALSDRRLLHVSLSLLGLSLLARIVLIHAGVSTNALYTMTFTHLDGLAVGSCLAVCARSVHLASIVRRVLPWAAVMAAGGLVAARLVDGDLYFWSRQMATFGYTCCAVLFGALLFWSLNAPAQPMLRLALTGRFMSQMGKLSYALYMVHVPIASLTFAPLWRLLEPIKMRLGYDVAFVCFMLIAFAASWAAAWLSWHLFEKRILALKRHFNYDSNDAAPAAARAVGSTPHMPRG